MGFFQNMRNKIREGAEKGYDTAKKEAKFRYAMKKAEMKQNKLDARRIKAFEQSAYKEAKQKENVRLARAKGRADAKKPKMTIFASATKKQSMAFMGVSNSPKNYKSKKSKGKSPLDNDYFF